MAPTVPRAVADLVRDLLSLKREDRPDAQVLADRIDAIRDGGSVRATRGAPGQPAFEPFAYDGRQLRIIDLEVPAEHRSLGQDLTRALRDAAVTVKSIRLARSSDADLVLAGEVRVSGERARATLRLQSRVGATRWSGRIDGLISEPFDLEDAVVKTCVEALVTESAPRTAPANDALTPDYRRAHALVGGFDPAGWQEAVAILEELSRRDPEDATIRSVLARALSQIWMTSSTADPGVAARAEELALRALQADPSLGEAYLAVATLRRARGDYRAAVRSMRQALEHSPAFGPAHHLLGRFLCEAGHVDEGLHRLDVGGRLGERSVIAQSVELRVRALLGHEARARDHLARLKSEGLLASVAQTTCELAIWWNDRALAAEAAADFQRSSSSAVWARFTPVLQAFARGEAIEWVEPQLQTTSSTGWGRMRAGMIHAAMLIASNEVEAAKSVVLQVSDEPTCIDLLWLDRAPSLVVLRATPEFATARAKVAMRVSEIGL